MEERALCAAATEKPAGASFALPASVVELHVAAIAERGIVCVRRNVRCDPYLLDAFVFENAPNEHSRAFDGVCAALEETVLPDTVMVRAGRRRIPYFCGKTGKVTVVPKPAEGRDPALVEQEIERKAYFRVQGALERFSRLAGGLAVNFYAEDRHTHVPPPPDQKHTINIYPWNHPPGDSDSHYKSRIFDLLVDKDGDKILMYKGVPGRGEFVSDGKIDIVQMIGNQWYLLFSVIEYFNEHTTVRIHEQALAAVLKRYQALQRGARPSHTPKRADRKRFVKAATEWLNRGLGFYEDEVKKNDQNIEQYREYLLGAERYRADLRRIIAELKDGERTKRIIESFPAQWKCIRKNPRLSDVSLASDGVQATTVPVVIEHEGIRHPLGRFVLRMNKYGQRSIWNLDRLHPEGVPHPHISKSGHPCFGNATSAINDAVVSHRYADAFEYLTQWLFDGYEENLATHKITEWPAEEAPCRT